MRGDCTAGGVHASLAWQHHNNRFACLYPLQVPTFIFYRGGKEVSRFTGSSRGAQTAFASLLTLL